MQHYNPPMFQLLLFAAACALGVYLLNCLIMRKWRKLNWEHVVLHVVAMAAMGVVGEVAVNTMYHFVVGRPLWTYTVYPIHHDYTSQYAALLWGVYGLNLYMLHSMLTLRHKLPLYKLAVIFGFESMIFETLIDVAYKLTFGHYFFYYWPADLWHFTTVQVLPLYALCGFVVFTVFRKFGRDPKFFIPLSAGIGWVVAFLAT